MNERTRVHVNYLLMGWFGAIIGAAVGGWRWAVIAFLGYWFVVLAVSVVVLGAGLLWQRLYERRHIIDPAWRRFTKSDSR